MPTGMRSHGAHYPLGPPPLRRRRAPQWYQLVSELLDEHIMYPPPETYSFRASAERTRA
jgi:hypothetical protein